MNNTEHEWNSTEWYKCACTAALQMGLNKTCILEKTSQNQCDRHLVVKYASRDLRVFAQDLEVG